MRKIGYFYVNEARQHLSGFLGLAGFAAEIKEKAHMLKEVIGALKSVFPPPIISFYSCLLTLTHLLPSQTSNQNRYPRRNDRNSRIRRRKKAAGT